VKTDAMKWVVVAAALLALGLSVLPAAANEQKAETAPALEAPKAKERPRPAAWDRWGETKRQQWTRRMERAREAVRKHEQARLNAAVSAMEQTAAEGVPVEEAEQMAKTGLDEGLQPEEFGNLGKFVKSRVQQGLRGQQLADAIHQQIKLRHQQRWEERERKRQQRELRKKERSESRTTDRGADGEEDEQGQGRGRGGSGGGGRGRGGR